MNTNAKHTTGPWQYSPGHDPHNQAQIYGEDGNTLAITFSDEGNANARLMASAPTLLEAAKQVIWKLSFEHSPSGKGGDCHHARMDRTDATVKMLCEAIAKAEGAQS